MISSSESVIVKVPMLVHSYVPLQVPQVEFDYSQPNVIISIANIIIDLILKTITILDNCRTCILTSPGSNSGEPVSYKSVVRGQLFDAVEVLRVMTPNNGNMMHISQLPDDCLMAIFANDFSLQKMFSTVGRVCHRWKAIVDGWNCALKQTLKLFGSDEDVQEYYAD